jgi:hypothetical protein
MKRIISLIIAVITIAGSAFAERTVFIYRNDGTYNSFLDSEIKDMEYSNVDSIGVEHNNYLYQIICTANDTMRIPLSAIDSVSFVSPAIKISTDTSLVASTAAILYGYAHGTVNARKSLKIGIVVDTLATPTISSGKVILSRSSKDGAYNMTFVGLKTKTKYYYQSFMAIDSVYYYGDTKSFVTNDFQKAGTAIDLGLSVMWADQNVGENIGDYHNRYFGWADPTGRRTTTIPSEYPSNNPPKCICGTDYDMARANWGGKWRMPTREEWTELIEKCKWIFGVPRHSSDYVAVTGPSGKSIRLIKDAFMFDGNPSSPGEYGDYWSCDLDTTSINYAYKMGFNIKASINTMRRDYGLSVRPVLDYPQSVTSDSVTSVASESAILNCTVRGTKNPHTSLTIGIIYGTNSSINATEGTKIASEKISDGSYSVKIDNLQKGTTYYYRGYMQFDSTYYYGDISSFITKTE